MSNPGHRSTRLDIQFTMRLSGADAEDLDFLRSRLGGSHADAGRKGIRYLAAAIRKADAERLPAPRHPMLLTEVAP